MRVVHASKLLPLPPLLPRTHRHGRRWAPIGAHPEVDRRDARVRVCHRAGGPQIAQRQRVAGGVHEQDVDVVVVDAGCCDGRDLDLPIRLLRHVVDLVDPHGEGTRLLLAGPRRAEGSGGRKARRGCEGACMEKCGVPGMSARPFARRHQQITPWLRQRSTHAWLHLRELPQLLRERRLLITWPRGSNGVPLGAAASHAQSAAAPQSPTKRHV